MQFHTQEYNGILQAVFPENTPRSWVLTSFLEDVRTSINDFLDMIDQAPQHTGPPLGLTCNQVDVEFYPDRAVIEHLWPVEGETWKVELPLNEVKQLLIDYQQAMEQWQFSKTK